MGCTQQMCQGWYQQAATDAARCARHTGPLGPSHAAWLLSGYYHDMGCNRTVDCLAASRPDRHLLTMPTVAGMAPRLPCGACYFTFCLPAGSLHDLLCQATQLHFSHKSGFAGSCCG